MGPDMTRSAESRRRPGPTPRRPKVSGLGTAVARKSFSKPLKRLKMDSGRTRRAEIRRRRAAALAGDRVGGAVSAWHGFGAAVALDEKPPAAPLHKNAAPPPHKTHLFAP